MASTPTIHLVDIYIHFCNYYRGCNTVAASLIPDRSDTDIILPGRASGIVSGWTTPHTYVNKRRLMAFIVILFDEFSGIPLGIPFSSDLIPPSDFSFI